MDEGKLLETALTHSRGTGVSLKDLKDAIERAERVQVPAQPCAPAPTNDPGPHSSIREAGIRSPRLICTASKRLTSFPALIIEYAVRGANAEPVTTTWIEPADVDWSATSTLSERPASSSSTANTASGSNTRSPATCSVPIELPGDSANVILMLSVSLPQGNLALALCSAG